MDMGKANGLRSALKAAGYKANQVTVRDRGGSVDTSLEVTIRSAAVSVSAVTAIANKVSVVNRCTATGEILGGGNTFVTVSYSRDLIAPIQASIEAQILAGQGDATIGTISVHVDNLANSASPVYVGRASEDTSDLYCYGVDYAAKRLAAESLDFEALLGAQILAA